MSPAWDAAFIQGVGVAFFRCVNKKITIMVCVELLSAPADVARFLLFNSFGLIQKGEISPGFAT